MDNIPNFNDAVKFSDECFQNFVESEEFCERNKNNCSCCNKKPDRCDNKNCCCCPCPPDNKQCSKDVIGSIALVESSLAHILNAEGEKIQKAVKLTCSVDELLKINRSVQNTLIHATFLEHTLFAKLDRVCSGCCRR